MTERISVLPLLRPGKCWKCSSDSNLNIITLYLKASHNIYHKRIFCSRCVDPNNDIPNQLYKLDYSGEIYTECISFCYICKQYYIYDPHDKLSNYSFFCVKCNGLFCLDCRTDLNMCFECAHKQKQEKVNVEIQLIPNLGQQYHTLEEHFPKK